MLKVGGCVVRYWKKQRENLYNLLTCTLLVLPKTKTLFLLLIEITIQTTKEKQDHFLLITLHTFYKTTIDYNLTTVVKKKHNSKPLSKQFLVTVQFLMII